MAPYKSEEHFFPSVLEALAKDPVKDYKLVKGAMYLMRGGEFLIRRSLFSYILQILIIFHFPDNAWYYNYNWVFNLIFSTAMFHLCISSLLFDCMAMSGREN